MAIIAWTRQVHSAGEVREGTYNANGNFPLAVSRVPLRPGTLSNYRLKVHSNTLNSSSTFEALVDGVGWVSVVVGAGVTGLFTPASVTSPTAAFDASFKATVGATLGIIEYAMSVEYDPS